MSESIILFGGSFDPPHSGHRRMAKVAMEHTGADRLLVVPARRSPHKSDMPVSSDDRIEMCRRAFDGLEGVDITPIEANRAPPSYTVDTVRQLQQCYPDIVTWYLLVGEDAYADLPEWRSAGEIAEKCHILVAPRTGTEPPPDPEGWKVTWLEMDLVDISASSVRGALALGREGDTVAASVAGWIRQRGLYRTRPAPRRLRNQGD